jgi:hypothetical protein
LEDKQLKAMRWEFKFLIDRCACSRASMTLTPEEAKQWEKEGLGKFKPIKASCTPTKCFSTISKLLYPNGGLNKVSYLIKNNKKDMK